MYAKKQGFTLIELLIGALASMIVALAAGSIMFYFWSGWKQHMDSVALQRDAMVAARIIEHHVRNAHPSEIGGLGTATLSFSGDEPYTFSSADMAMGEDIQLQSFTATNDAFGAVVVSFELATARGTDLGQYRLRVYPRNGL